MSTKNDKLAADFAAKRKRLREVQREEIAILAQASEAKRTEVLETDNRRADRALAAAEAQLERTRQINGITSSTPAPVYDPTPVDAEPTPTIEASSVGKKSKTNGPRKPETKSSSQAATPTEE